MGRRARFQRISDGKLFSGWIEGCDHDRVCILPTSNVLPMVGDSIYLEGCADSLAVSFQGLVREAISGATPRVYVSCNGEIRFGPPHESARRRIRRHPVMAYPENGFPFNAFILDVSKHSIGLTCGQEIPRNSVVELKIESQVGSVTVEGHVLYCVPDRRQGKAHRFGLFIPEMPRLEQQRWERFVAELA